MRAGRVRDCSAVGDIHTDEIVCAIGDGTGVAAYEVSRGIEGRDDDEGLAVFRGDSDLHSRRVAGGVGTVAGIVSGYVVCAAREALRGGVGHGSRAAEGEVVQALGGGGWTGEGGDEGNVAGGSAGSRVGRDGNVHRDVLGGAVLDACGRREREGRGGPDGGRGAPRGCEIIHVDGAEAGGHVISGGGGPSLSGCVGRID